MAVPVSSSNLATRISGILWGKSKTGKTTYAMSLPGRKLLILFDPDGYMSVAHRDDFDLLDLSLLTPSDAISEAKKAAQFIKENPDKYQSVIVDSLTTLVSAAMNDAISRGIGKSSIFTPTLEAPGLTGYGARNANAVDVIERIMRATGINKQNCFFIAHEDDPVMSQDGKTIVEQTIMLSAKIRNNAGLRVSEIYYLGLASGNRRTLYLAPFGILSPMGSRIFNTKVLPKFELDYDPEKPDAEQPHALCNIIEKFNATKQKLSSPK